MNNQAHVINIGDFITVPAWKTFGCVIDKRPNILGTEYAQTVLLQESPDDENGRWFRVEPNEFHFVD